MLINMYAETAILGNTRTRTGSRSCVRNDFRRSKNVIIQKKGPPKRASGEVASVSSNRVWFPDSSFLYGPESAP